jgi:Leucine-rich repeat (LRR) protein
MAGLGQLKHVRKLDLGANRIREMDEKELSGLENLEELWIGKNKIEMIQGLEKVRIDLLLCTPVILCFAYGCSIS